MSFPKEKIEAGKSYLNAHGQKLYVQDVQGQKVEFVVIGGLNRLKASLGRFASLIEREIPNQ